jgi:ferredoxin-like protein FixX
MELDKQIRLGHLLLADRQCRVCGEMKNLIDGFYRTRKDRGAVASSYSYECKECTIKRVVSSRMVSSVLDKWEYPDW